MVCSMRMECGTGVGLDTRLHHRHDLMRHWVLGEDQSLSKEAPSPVIKGSHLRGHSPVLREPQCGVRGYHFSF